VAKAIEWHLQEKGKNVKTEPMIKISTLKRPPKEERVSYQRSLGLIFQRGACPECGGPLIFEEGCVKCFCGYSDCG
jgi:hypothetical protein